MNTRNVDQVLWKFLTRTDFSAMNGLWAGEKGGSAKHITLPPSKKEKIADFFDVSPFPPAGQNVIDKQLKIEPVEGIPGSEGPIKITCKLDRRGGEWRIADQHQNRYVLWSSDYGFPSPDTVPWEDDDYYDINPPIIYFVKDSDGNFHARAANDTSSETLSRFPSELSHRWESAGKRNNFGIVRFTDVTLEEASDIDE